MKHTSHSLSQRAVLLAFTFTVFASPTSTLWGQPSDTPDTRFWRTDGPVNDIHVTSDTVYIGGDFSYVGPSAQLGVVDTTTAAFKRGFPAVAGRVLAAAPDGSGGWYLGGSFTSVGSVAVTNLAHVRASNVVDPTWKPSPNNNVNSLILQDSILYVGGVFTRLAGQTRNRLAAYDVSKDELTAFNPNVNGFINTMTLSGSTLYVAGNFSSIGSKSRGRLASVDAVTGTVTDWNPGVNGEVRSISVVGNQVYIGGAFTIAGTKPRNRIALFNVGENLPQDWNPNANQAVNSLVVAENQVYVAGSFTSVGGAARNRLASLDIGTGVATSWNPDASGEVIKMILSGDTFYIAGGFATVSGKARRYLAALDKASAAVTSWNPLLSSFTAAAGEASLIVLNDPSLFVEGTFGSLGGVARNNVAALSLSTGEATEWNPDANAPVYAIVASHNLVYIGGTFTNLGTTVRRRLAAVDPVTGVPTDWDPNVIGRNPSGGSLGASVVSFLATPDRLYVGGSFTVVGGAARTSLAAFELPNGALSSWTSEAAAAQPSQSASVNALALEGTTLYAGGDFVNLGGQPRNRLGAVSTGSGSATAWNPNVNQAVNTIGLDGETLYVGGLFTKVGTQTRNKLAAISTVTGMATLWDPDAGTSGRVNSLAVSENLIEVGGNFGTIAGEFRNRLVAIRKAAAQADGWNPNMNLAPLSVVRTLEAVYVGGDFTTIGGKPFAYFAIFSSRPVFVPPSPEIENDGHLKLTVRSGDGTDVLIQATRDFQAWEDIGTTPLTGRPVTIEDPDGTGKPERFYRAVLR